MPLQKTLLAGLLAAATLTAIAATCAIASSHREAPAISKDPTADNTDVYAFVSPNKPGTVTLISNWDPLLEPAGGPNFFQFDPAARYLILVDNVGDARDHIVYEFKFTTEIQNGNTFLYNTGPITSIGDPDYNIRQFYTVIRWDNGKSTVLGRHLAVPPSRVGPKSTPDYDRLTQEGVYTLSDGSKVFAGERDDPFFVDLGAIFDLLTIRKLPGNQGDGVDGLGGFNTLTIALQVPKKLLTHDGRDVNDGNKIIGVYSTTERRVGTYVDAGIEIEDTAYNSNSVQVSRLGSPLVNEVVIPLKDKDKWNHSSPRDDGQFLEYVTNPELAGLLNAIYGIKVPPAPRNDLVAVFLTGVAGLTQPKGVVPAEFLRLNMAIPPAQKPNRLGVLAGDVAGFPNGRRLGDDIVDIELRAVAGVLVPGFNVAPNNQLGDGVDTNDRPFLPYFPYVGKANDPFNHGHHRREPVHSASHVASTDARPDVEDLTMEVSDVDADEAIAGDAAVRIVGPNPTSRPELEYSIPRNGHVTLRIYDLQGRDVRTIVDQDAAAGSFRARWDGRGNDGAPAGKGVFFARFAVDQKVVSTKKLVVH